MKFQHDIDASAHDHPWIFLVGQHVWLKGSSDEFVVMDVDRETGELQLLPLGRLGHIEAVAVTRLRAVLPPRVTSSDDTGQMNRSAA